jgi:hypothetical protein
LRLREADEKNVPWKKWGPYLSERQRGTVREDYSESGDAWNYFSHDQARSRAYRWGEDGLAGISDDRKWLCLALALWNGRAPILKERLFGLTDSEGNHGEDVKEYDFYLDSTRTHSYMNDLYKCPQDEEDGFFYDVLRLPDGRAHRLKVRSMVGLLPLCAVTVFEGQLIDKVPGDGGTLAWISRCAPGTEDRHLRPLQARLGRPPTRVHSG